MWCEFLNAVPTSDRRKRPKAIAGFPKPDRRNIGFRIESLREELQEDVKKLEANRDRYRLRVGSFRILFTLEGDPIAIYAVKDRKNAYE